MIRKLFYVGLVLIVLSIIILFAVALPLQQNVVSSLIQNLSISNLTVNMNSYNSTPMRLYNTSLIFAIAQTTAYANIYLFNSSAFGEWKTALASNSPPSGFNEALSLSSHGAFVIYNNVMQATVPFSSQNLNSSTNLTPTNQTNATMLYNPGTYYVVIDNTNGSASQNKQIFARVLYYQSYPGQSVNATAQAEASQFKQLAIVSLGLLLLSISGIILTIYGYFKKPKAGSEEDLAQKQKDGMNVDEIYKDMDKKKRSKKGTR